MTVRHRRAVLAAAGLAAVFVLLGALGASAWCDDERFGYFVQAHPAPLDVPSVPFTVADSERWPDVQRALDRVGQPVRARDPEGARAFVADLEAQGAAAVEVAQGNFYVAGYEQTPSETWVRVCS